MISFDSFHAVDGTPIYLQMIKHIKRGLAAGVIINGDELPSRRLLSATLAVNPNTVQKAYRLMEDEGLIVSRPGSGSVISASKEQIAAIKNELYREELQGAVFAMKHMGLSLEDAVNLMKQLYEEEEK